MKNNINAIWTALTNKSHTGEKAHSNVSPNNSYTSKIPALTSTAIIAGNLMSAESSKCNPPVPRYDLIALGVYSTAVCSYSDWEIPQGPPSFARIINFDLYVAFAQERNRTDISPNSSQISCMNQSSKWVPSNQS